MSLIAKPLETSSDVISEKTLAIHHDKLYAGYVTKSNEIREKLTVLEKGGDVASANQSYSELRGLKEGETFALNGVYLHEHYFDTLGGTSAPEGAIAEALTEAFGSLDNFMGYFTGCGMAARGWALLAWDSHAQALRVYNADAHNQGGIWGAFPILVLDVYEHAYFIDYGSDRKAYIQAWWETIDWKKVNERYLKAKMIPSVL